MTRVLVAAVILAQAFDVVTWMAMPRAAEVNPLAQGLHSSSAWLLKSALVLLVFVLDEVVRNAGSGSSGETAAQYAVRPT